MLPDVVIPVAAERSNSSINWALRSIANWYPGHHVILVGHRPRLDPHNLTIDHIPTEQTDDIFANTDLAMQTALDSDLVNDPFIWSADDIYWMRPAEPIRWALGLLDEDQHRTIYGQRKHATAHFLRSHGLPAYDYEAHVPMLIHPNPMHTVLNWCDTDPMLDKRSLYGNLTGLPDHIGSDVKNQSRAAPLPDASWCSTGGNPRAWPALMQELNRPGAIAS